MDKETLYALLGLGIGGFGGYFGQQALNRRRLANQQAPLTFDQQKELALISAGFDKDGNPLGQEEAPPVVDEGEDSTPIVQDIIESIVGPIDPISPNTGTIEVPFQEGDEFFQEGILGVDPAEKDDRLFPGDYVPRLAEDFINTYASAMFPEYSLPQPPEGMTQGDFSVPDIAFTPEGDEYLKNIALTAEDDPFFTTAGLAGDKNLSFYKEADKLPVEERKKIFKQLIEEEIKNGNISIPKDPSNRSGLMDEEEFADLLLNMVGQESSYRFLGPDSEKGAVGPMQLMPGTYGTEPGFGVDPITDTQARDPLQNLIFGGNYFSGLTDYYTDKGYRRGKPAVNPDIQRALAAYNFGPGNVNALGLDQFRYEPDADNFIPQETINYLDALGYPLLGAPQGEIPLNTMNSREARQNMQNMIIQQELEGTGGGLGLNVADPEERALKGLTGDIYMTERNRTLDPLYQGTGFNSNVFPNQMNFTDIDEDGNAIYEYIFGPDYYQSMDPNIMIPYNQGGRVGLSGGGGGGIKDERDEVAFDLFGKPYVELNTNEFEQLLEEMMRLHNLSTGGRVGLEPGGSLSDDITDLMNSLSMYKGPDSMMAQLSDAEDFLRAERLGEDDPKYNYTLGMGLDDLMPGLSFEAGVMDDAVFGPGMMSPDDYKFLKFKKTF